MMSQATEFTRKDANRMDQCENQSVIAFDTLYTTNHIQILKILLPFVDLPSQKKLIILIKFLELQYALACVNRFPASVPCENARTHPFSDPAPDIIALYEQIKNFCTPTERAMFEQLSNMKRGMEMYEEMTNMMKMFSQLDQKTGEDAAAGTDPMELLKSMLSPEQQAMFDLFSAS